MKFPLRSTVQIGKYVATQKRKGEIYPLVLMLEPTLACNLACIALRNFHRAGKRAVGHVVIAKPFPC